MNRGNNKITELRTILQRESQNAYVYKHKISQQPENCENRNDPDLVRQTSRFHCITNESETAYNPVYYSIFCFMCNVL